MAIVQLSYAPFACRLEEHEKDRLRVVTENDILKQKINAMVDQYHARDNHFNQQVSVHGVFCDHSFPTGGKAGSFVIDFDWYPCEQ